MPDVSDFAQLPYPTGPDAPDVPAAMMALVEALDTKINLQAATIGERDSKYADLPPGAIVTTTQSPWNVWLRTQISEGVFGWATLYDFVDWTPFSSTDWRPGWDDLEVNGQTASGWARSNNRVEIYLRATYTGDPVLGPTPSAVPAVVAQQWGNIQDLPVIDLPSNARPVKGQAPGMFLASCPGAINVSVAGTVTITHLWPGGTLSTDTVLTYTDNWRR